MTPLPLLISDLRRTTDARSFKVNVALSNPPEFTAEIEMRYADRKHMEAWLVAFNLHPVAVWDDLPDGALRVSFPVSVRT